MKIGLLGWDHGVMGKDGPYGDWDPDGPALIEHGRGRGHEMALFTIEDISYVPGANGIEVMCGEHPSSSFDAIISRARLSAEDWRGRVERLTMLSEVPGVRLFDPAEVWTRTSSKFHTTQWLAAAGLPVAPTRSAETLADVGTACDEWGDIIIKPPYGYRSRGVERITDFSAKTDVITNTLKEYGVLLCMPFYPTKWGEYRITVAGEATPMSLLKLPAAGEWKNKPAHGGSYERITLPEDLRELSLRAARAMGLTLTSLDIIPTETGYVILELNSIPGFMGELGEDSLRAVLAGVYDWVEKRVAED